MELGFNIAQVVIAALLVTCILLQAKGSGLGAAFGESDMVFSTRRGPEKVIFTVTIILSMLFLALSATRLFLF